MEAPAGKHNSILMIIHRPRDQGCFGMLGLTVIWTLPKPLLPSCAIVGTEPPTTPSLDPAQESPDAPVNVTITVTATP